MEGYRTYWFIKLVLPTPLSPRIMTYWLLEHHATLDSQLYWGQTFNSFLREEDMLCDGAPCASDVCSKLWCFGLGAVMVFIADKVLSK